MLDHESYIKEVIDLAKSSKPDEVPVAAIVVDISTGEIIAQANNTREETTDLMGHAEINALKIASKKIGSWNLSGYALYVSLEPCAMCAGAILQSHISQVVFSAYDSKSGAFGSRYNLINKNIKVLGGILEEESIKVLKQFFKDKR